MAARSSPCPLLAHEFASCRDEPPQSKPRSLLRPSAYESSRSAAVCDHPPVGAERGLRGSTLRLPGDSPERGPIDTQDMIYDRSWGGTVALARSWGAWRRQAFGTRLTALAIASLVVVATGGVARSAAAALGNLRMSVIVRTLAGDGTPAEQAVRGLGGTVGLRLGIIDGFSATIPAAALTTLRTMPAIVSVSPNTHLRPESASYDPGADVNS